MKENKEALSALEQYDRERFDNYRTQRGYRYIEQPCLCKVITNHNGRRKEENYMAALVIGPKHAVKDRAGNEMMKGYLVDRNGSFKFYENGHNDAIVRPLTKREIEKLRK